MVAQVQALACLHDLLYRCSGISGVWALWVPPICLENDRWDEGVSLAVKSVCWWGGSF
jgi:hypothetical protein